MDLREAVNVSDWDEERFSLSKNMRMFNLHQDIMFVNYFLVDAMVLVYPISLLYFERSVINGTNGFVAVETSIGLDSSLPSPPIPIALVITRGLDSKCFPVRLFTFSRIFLPNADMCYVSCVNNC